MSVFLNEIKYCIESQLNKGMKNFVIFPYGDIGMEVENLLKKVYGIDPIAIIDNGSIVSVSLFYLMCPN